MVKQTQVVSGKFTSGDGKKGNFTAYNAKNEPIFIHKNTMEAAGFKTDKDLKFPLFVIVGEKEINTRDENGELNDPPVLVKRVQGLSVFTTKAAMIEAYNADATFEIEAKAALQTTATAAGLSQKAVDALLEASI